jgi:hypothetical protein
MEKQSLYQDIDETLDQLLKNEQALDFIEENPEFTREKQALEKTQESLVAHLLHVHNHLEKRYKNRLRKSRTEKVRNIALRYSIH